METEADEHVTDDQRDDPPEEDADEPCGKVRASDVENWVTSGQWQGKQREEGAEPFELSSRFHGGEYKLVSDAYEPHPLLRNPPSHS